MVKNIKLETDTKVKIIIYLFLGALALLPSCNKYEEGPKLSFKSRKERVANTWEVEKAIKSGNDVTSEYDQYELQLLTSGYAKLAALYSSNGLQFEYETTGTWSLENDDENLRLDFEDNDADKTYLILKLLEDEMWLREVGGDTELHLRPM